MTISAEEKAKLSAEVIEAFRIAEQEMQDEWEARQAAVQAAVANGHPLFCDPNLLLASHWILVFAPDWAKSVLNGLPVGHALDRTKQCGHKLPPAVEAVWQEWHDKIEAARLERDAARYPWNHAVRRRRHHTKARRAP